jgi:hypothetical protein
VLLNFLGLVVVDLKPFLVLTCLFDGFKQHHQWVELTLLVKGITCVIENHLKLLVLGRYVSLLVVIHDLAVVTACDEELVDHTQFGVLF